MEIAKTIYRTLVTFQFSLLRQLTFTVYGEESVTASALCPGLIGCATPPLHPRASRGVMAAICCL